MLNLHQYFPLQLTVILAWVPLFLKSQTLLVFAQNQVDNTLKFLRIHLVVREFHCIRGNCIKTDHILFKARRKPNINYQIKNDFLFMLIVSLNNIKIQFYEIM